MANQNGNISGEIQKFLTTLRRFHAHANLVEALRFDGEFPSQAEALVAPGEYQNMRRTEATHRYLFLSPMPQTAAQVHEALKRGRVKTTAKDPLKAQYTCMDYGRKVGRLKKYGTGDYWTGVR